jgi:flagellin-specific chaperone FliS
MTDCEQLLEALKSVIALVQSFTPFQRQHPSIQKAKDVIERIESHLKREKSE